MVINSRSFDRLILFIFLCFLLLIASTYSLNCRKGYQEGEWEAINDAPLLRRDTTPGQADSWNRELQPA